MKYESFQLKMSDNKSNVIHKWTPETESDFVVLFYHGLAEHALRYEELASFICENNGTILIQDHRGHGKTADVNNTKLGDVGKDTYKRFTEDIHEQINYAKKQFPSAKIILMGHSYGSLLVQYAIENYGREIDKAILLGTAGPRRTIISCASFLGAIIKLFRGSSHYSSFLHKLSISSNNSKFKDTKTEFDWLSSDSSTIDIYMMDKMCGFICSTRFMTNIYALIKNIHKKRNIKKIYKELPIKIMSGKDDAIGLMGKTVSNLASIYCKNGIKEVSLKLYNGARHELLNDKCRYDVINEIISFCKK